MANRPLPTLPMGHRSAPTMALPLGQQQNIWERSMLAGVGWSWLAGLLLLRSFPSFLSILPLFLSPSYVSVYRLFIVFSVFCAHSIVLVSHSLSASPFYFFLFFSRPSLSPPSTFIDISPLLPLSLFVSLRALCGEPSFLSLSLSSPPSSLDLSVWRIIQIWYLCRRCGYR